MLEERQYLMINISRSGHLAVLRIWYFRHLVCQETIFLSCDNGTQSLIAVVNNILYKQLSTQLNHYYNIICFCV